MLSVSLSVFGASCEYNHIQNVSLTSWLCGAVAQHNLFEFEFGRKLNISLRYVWIEDCPLHKTMCVCVLWLWLSGEGTAPRPRMEVMFLKPRIRWLC